MQQVVTLENLNDTLNLVKEYVDEHTSSSGGNAQLFCELEIVTDYTAQVKGRLYIKCYKGEILETDTLQFARNTSTPIHWAYDENNDKYYRDKYRRGWIIPHEANLVRLYKVYDNDKSSASDIYDYWEILPKNHDNEPITWQELLDEFLEHRHNCLNSSQWEYTGSVGISNGVWNNNYACFVNKWCGVGIVRDGKLISKYMKWEIEGPSIGQDDCTYQGHFHSIYTKIGTYTKSYNEDRESAGYIFRIK